MISWAWPNRAAGERAYGVDVGGVGTRGQRIPVLPAPDSSKWRSRRQLPAVGVWLCCGAMSPTDGPKFPGLFVRRCRSKVVTWRRIRMFNICILEIRGSCPDLGFCGTAPWGPFRHGGTCSSSMPEADKFNSTSILRSAMQKVSGTCPRGAPSALEIAAAFKKNCISANIAISMAI